MNNPHPPKPSDATILAQGRFLRLRSVNGWEYAERVNASGVVAILAITEERRILLVEQYRPPVGRAAVELPAGLVGDTAAGEGDVEAVRRELLEETGYRAGEVVLLGTGPSSAGLASEVITICHAKGLVRVGPAAGDGNEQITVHEVPVSGLRGWLEEQSRAGKAIDLKIGSALWLAGVVG